MKKKDVLNSIDNAIEYHAEQTKIIEKLIKGEKVSKLTPVNKQECDFGKWIYGDAKSIQALLGTQFYENIEAMHEYWHIAYSKINDIFYEQKSSFMSKILGNKRNVTSEARAEARKYYAELKITSDDIVQTLIACKRRVLALKKEAFVKIN